jgi:hypothetical protein
MPRRQVARAQRGRTPQEPGSGSRCRAGSGCRQGSSRRGGSGVAVSGLSQGFEASAGFSAALGRASRCRRGPGCPAPEVPGRLAAPVGQGTGRARGGGGSLQRSVRCRSASRLPVRASRDGVAPDGAGRRAAGPVGRRLRLSARSSGGRGPRGRGSPWAGGRRRAGRRERRGPGRTARCDRRGTGSGAARRQKGRGTRGGRAPRRSAVGPPGAGCGPGRRTGGGCGPGARTSGVRPGVHGRDRRSAPGRTVGRRLGRVPVARHDVLRWRRHRAGGAGRPAPPATPLGGHGEGHHRDRSGPRGGRAVDGGGAHVWWCRYRRGGP